MSSTLLQSPASAPAAHREARLAAFLSALRQVVASAEPGVVFTSLATICVPAFADECVVFIEETGAAAYQISRPPPTSRTGAAALPGGWLRALSRAGQEVTDHAVSTLIQAPPPSGAVADYRGVLIQRWHTGYRPTCTDAALAQAAVDRAVALISQQRLAERSADLQREVANLQIALQTSREIGAAIGILMANHRVSQAQAFDLLRTASQHRHYKLRDLAAEVALTGDLAGVLVGPTRRSAVMTPPAPASAESRWLPAVPSSSLAIG